MKLKEFPISFLQELQLNKIPVESLIDNKRVLPVYVSLTTILSRINKVHLVVRSILSQPYIPKKIILNLNDGLKDVIPGSLNALLGERFELYFSSLDCPHMKLIPTLKRFPDEIIITCDDDLLYQKNWLRLLYESHQEHPENIITNQSRIITLSEGGEPLPYKEWPTSYDSKLNTKRLLPIGSAGTLYPPNTLYEQVFDSKLFDKLSPGADDLWFKAMSLLKGTKSIQSSRLGKEPVPIIGSQKISLKKENIGQDRNREQWVALTKHFELSLKED